MYTTKEAALALGVTQQTIRDYTKLKQDALPAIQIGIRSMLRIREADLIAFAEKHRMAVIELKQ